jgi:hypothetical protein
MQRGDELHWLIAALKTHEKKGISNLPESLMERRAKYGTNQKYQP